MLGDTVMLKGTVTDESPAQKGKAAVSDESMATWMEYLHMQKPIDGTFHNVTVTGVPVTISVTDANGNSRVIGTTTSDITGGFGFEWTPEIPGKYTLFATFAGSNSYGSSFAQTYMTVAKAPAPPPEAPQPQSSMADTYLLPATASVVVTIVAVGAVLALIFRKRP